MSRSVVNCLIFEGFRSRSSDLCIRKCSRLRYRPFANHRLAMVLLCDLYDTDALSGKASFLHCIFDYNQSLVRFRDIYMNDLCVLGFGWVRRVF